MDDKTPRILYFLLFYLGWIGMLWTAYAFLINTYNGTINILTENPSFFILLCVSLMSIATAFMLERTGRTQQ